MTYFYTKQVTGFRHHRQGKVFLFRICCNACVEEVLPFDKLCNLQYVRYRFTQALLASPTSHFLGKIS